MGGKTEEYKEYLKEVCYYEKNRYLIDLSIQCLKEQMSGLGVVSHIEKPCDGAEAPGYRAFPVFCAGASMGFIPSLCISLVSYEFLETMWFSIVLFLSLEALACGAILLWENAVWKKKRRAAKQEQERVQKEYEQAVLREEERLETEEAKRQIIWRDIGNLERDRDACTYALQELYDCGVLHPKYQNFAAVASIYEYFDTGRCSELTGSDGAYNLYEGERRMDKIVEKLDLVLDQLEQIRRNQAMLYSAILESQEQSAALISETVQGIRNFSERTGRQLSQIVENNRLLAYNTQIAAESAQTLKHVVLYKERIGGSLPASYPKFDR